MDLAPLFSLEGRNAAVLGGGGVLGGAIAEALAAAGARVAVTSLSETSAPRTAGRIREAGGDARAYQMDALLKQSVEGFLKSFTQDFGACHVLVNAVGGNRKGATTSEDLSFFDLPEDDLRNVVDLNLLGGAVLPCQVFGEAMKDNADGGSVINITSMAASQPLTRIPGYSAAKAAVSNFTRWLAVHFAQEYTPKLRVNAIAPGFFLTEQNRFLLTDRNSGGLTERGKTIVAHTPMGAFGKPGDLAGAAVWLASDASRFVTGIVLPVDGGFSAFSGV